MKTTAIILAAGKGSRMHSKIEKQFMELGGYPVIYYALKTFEESPVDAIILVTGKTAWNIAGMRSWRNIILQRLYL